MRRFTRLLCLSLLAAVGPTAANLSAQCNPQESAEFGALAGVTGDRFGKVLARSGDTLVVGAPEANSAYVFERNYGPGLPWVETATLTSAAQTFGSSVAIDGDTIAVGTRKTIGKGNVRIFERDLGGPGNWGERIKVQGATTQSGDAFGAAVALDGDTLLVGAHLAIRGSKQGAGAAYVFERDAGGPDQWGEVQELAPPAVLNGNFGAGLALEGSRLAVGQPNQYGVSSPTARVRVYEHNGTTWNVARNVFPSGGNTGGQFGLALALQGDELVVGAPYETQGTVYVFERNTGGTGNWGELTKLRPETIGGQVGYSVDIDGDLLVAGAPWRGTPINSGRVLLYGRGFAGEEWGQMSKLAATTAMKQDYVGMAVSLSGGELVAGTDADNNAGLVYHFEGLVEFPHKYCPSGLSASTCLSVICATGTASATAPSGFVVEAQNMEGNKNGLYYFGANGQQAVPWGDGRSFQCVVGPVYRGAVISGGGTNGNCDGTFSYDLNARWTQKPNQNPGAGTVVQLQLWTRDPMNTSSQKTILSNALQFTVMP